MDLDWKVYHHPFCPHSRAARVILTEAGVDMTLETENLWERREDFLLLNPEGGIPVLELGGDTVCGLAAISEFVLEYGFDTNLTDPLLPRNWKTRAEYRRLRDWYDLKFGQEVSDPLAHEHVYRRQMGPEIGGGAPDTDILRLVGQNLKSHLAYTDYLLARSGWLVGERMTLADLIAAAHFSVVDYFGLIKWSEFESIRDWYARIKSRPSFQTILTARIPGVSPPDHYTAYDF